MSHNEIKNKLILLGPDVLADALLKLAEYSDVADRVVQRLVSSSDDKLTKVRQTLVRLKYSEAFYDWNSVDGFARDLEMLLEDLKSAAPNPETGLKFLADFYELDESICNQCDDSSGSIGYVFEHNAKDLFIEFASMCDNKDIVVETIVRVLKENECGLRDSLIDSINQCVSESDMRSLCSKFQQKIQSLNDTHEKRNCYMIIESLAEQLRDAELFEQTRIASWGKLSTGAFIDIARVYLSAGDISTAEKWLEKIPDGETFMAFERDEVWKNIFKQKGDQKSLESLIYKRFRANRSVSAFTALLDTIGHDKKESVITGEIPLISESNRLKASDLSFLIDAGKMNEAVEYLLPRAEQLNGDFYHTLLPIAEAFKDAKCDLAASLIYRSLLTSILQRGYTKSYRHGIRYLRTLDALSRLIDDWKQCESHEKFKARIHSEHKRKRSFWSKYDAK